MTDETDVGGRDPYFYLTHVFLDSLDGGEMLPHSDDPPVMLCRAETDANLWAIIVEEEVVTTFRGDAAEFKSTAGLAAWIDDMVDWWTTDQETQPPGFDRGGSAFA